LRNNKYWALSNIIIMKRFIEYWINMKKLYISHLALFCLLVTSLEGDKVTFSSAGRNTNVNHKTI
jgi:hypothetical protein